MGWWEEHGEGEGAVRSLERGDVVLPLQPVREGATQTTVMAGGKSHLRPDIVSDVGVQGKTCPTLNHPLHRDAYGVYQLAMLLMELDAEDETSCLLVADALYLLGRLDDAHKSLRIALSRKPQAAPVLVRLALLQLRRGFCYDANQVRRPGWVCTDRSGHCSAENTVHPMAPDLLPTAWALE